MYGEHLYRVYSAEQSDYTDVSDDIGGDDEEVNDPSYPGSSMQLQVPIWSLKKNMQKTLPDFISKREPSDELWELQEKTPIAVFQTLFRVYIVFESNLYATQSGKD